eukprot:scaffold59090_cov45-Phaeocystis_antarctica.AAC.1
MVRRRSPRLQRRTQAAAERLWLLAEAVSLWATALGILVAPIEERCGSSVPANSRSNSRSRSRSRTDDATQPPADANAASAPSPLRRALSAPGAVSAPVSPALQRSLSAAVPLSPPVEGVPVRGVPVANTAANAAATTAPACCCYCGGGGGIGGGCGSSGGGGSSNPEWDAAVAAAQQWQPQRLPPSVMPPPTPQRQRSDGSGFGVGVSGSGGGGDGGGDGSVRSRRGSPSTLGSPPVGRYPTRWSAAEVEAFAQVEAAERRQLPPRSLHSPLGRAATAPPSVMLPPRSPQQRLPPSALPPRSPPQRLPCSPQHCCGPHCCSPQQQQPRSPQRQRSDGSGLGQQWQPPSPQQWQPQSPLSPSPQSPLARSYPINWTADQVDAAVRAGVAHVHVDSEVGPMDPAALPPPAHLAPVMGVACDAAALIGLCGPPTPGGMGACGGVGSCGSAGSGAGGGGGA